MKVCFILKLRVIDYDSLHYFQEVLEVLDTCMYFNSVNFNFMQLAAE